MKYSKPQEKLFLYFSICIIGFACFAIFSLLAHFFGYEYPVGSFLFAPFDRFNDFFNVNTNPFYRMGDPYISGQSNYPPFIMAIVYFVIKSNSVFNQDLSSHIGEPIGSMIRDTSEGFFTYLIFVGLFCIVSVVICGWYINKKVNYGKLKSYVIALFFLVNVPIIWLIDRGNYLIIAIVFCFLFFFNYESKPLFAAICLGVAIAIKMYPAFLILLYVFPKPLKRIKEIVVSIGTVAILSIFPLFFFKGGFLNNFIAFFKYSLGFASGYESETLNTYSVIGLSGLLRVPFVSAEGVVLPPNYPVDFIFYIVAGLFVVLTVAVLFSSLSSLKKMIFVAFVMVFITPLSYVYNLAYLLPCILMFLIKEKEKQGGFYTVLFALLMIPKTYYYFYELSPYCVSVQTLIEPLLLLCVLGMLTFEAFKSKQTKFSNEICKYESI